MIEELVDVKKGKINNVLPFHENLKTSICFTIWSLKLSKLYIFSD